MKRVSAGLVFCENKLLIAQRKRGKPQEYLWEFPGGKLEEGETMPQCLARELNEEFGINVKVGDFFAKSVFDYETGSISLEAYFAECASQDLPKLEAHEHTQWIDVSELSRYEFAPADRPIVAKLQEKFNF